MAMFVCGVGLHRTWLSHLLSCSSWGKNLVRPNHANDKTTWRCPPLLRPPGAPHSERNTLPLRTTLGPSGLTSP